MKILSTLLFYLFFVFGTTLFANDDFKGLVSLVGMSMDYKEYNDAGELVDSEESSFTDIMGIDAGIRYEFDKDKKGYSQLDYNFMIVGGNGTYKGAYLNGGLSYGSVVVNSKHVVIDTSISYRYNVIFDLIKFSYGVGVGYHYWDRTLSDVQQEIYTWYSIRPVLGFSYSFNEKIMLSVDMEYQYGFHTLMSSTNPKLEFVLGGANIFEVSVPITYRYNDKVDLFLEMVFQNQTIAKSEVEYDGNDGYYEPDSRAYNNYMKLGVAFKF
jgi:hypothetical protein